MRRGGGGGGRKGHMMIFHPYQLIVKLLVFLLLRKKNLKPFSMPVTCLVLTQLGGSDAMMKDAENWVWGKPNANIYDRGGRGSRPSADNR